MRWLKRIGCGLLVVVLFLAALALFVRLEGIPYTLALAGGYARPLPDAATYATTASGGALPCASGPITVVTYNIFNGAAFVERMVERYGEGNIQGFLPWSQRVGEIGERIASYNPDLIGMQEMGWDDDLHDVVPSDAGYTLVSYKIGSLEYGDSAFFFRTERFDLLDHGQMWLGRNPELPLSYGYKRLSVPRYVNWGVLREKETQFTFLYVNTHFDNNTANKDPASKRFRERITELAKVMPVLCTGDFNSTGDNPRYAAFTGMDQTPPLLQNLQSLAAEKLVHESHAAAPRPLAPEDESLHYLRRIDHIIAGGPCPIVARRWLIDTRPMKNGERISDHDLMAAELHFGAPVEAMLPTANQPPPE